MFLGLTGNKGSGKSTAARILEEKGFERVSLAGPMKFIIEDVIGIDGYTLNHPSLKESLQINLVLDRPVVRNLLWAASEFQEIDPDLIERVSDDFNPVLLDTPRRLMQFLGTELFRNKIDEHFWLKALSNTIEDTSRNYVCDDLRFQNEVDYLKTKYSVKVVLIQRLGLVNSDSHVSEKLNVTYDYKLLNNDIEDFRKDLLCILDEVNGKTV